MKYPAYPKVKDSGVAWLGDVPEHWEIKRLRHVLSEKLTYGANESSDQDDPDMTRYVRITDIDDKGNLRPETFRSLPDEIAAPYLLNEGDILFARSGATSGKSFLYKQEWGRCAYAGYLIRARLNQIKILPRYLKYFACSLNYWSWLSSSYIQSTIQNVSAEKYADMHIGFPLLTEQIAIADFLDRETGRIDALIEKKRKLIALLEEKRSTLISRTVTRGLPTDVAKAYGLEPHTQFKDSDVAWLGEVPAHWEIKKLGYLTQKIGSGKTPSGGAETYSDEGVIFLRSQNVYDDGLRLSDVVYIDEEIDIEMANSRVKPKDVLLNITGASLGRTCIVPTEFQNANVNQHVCIIRLSKVEQSDYIAWVMKSLPIKAQIQHSQTGAARDGLNFDQIAELVLCLPAQVEQTAIADYLDRETAKLDRLKAKVDTAIERLQEYRSALITAAVTGKIDVRQAA